MKTTNNKKSKKRKLSTEEFRSLLPEKLNKFGEWMLANREAWDYGDGRVVLR